VKGGDKDKATLDVIGEVIDEAKRPIGRVRETVKLSVDEQQQVKQKNIQYSTSFSLPPGKYTMKFVVRENESGHMGSFVTDIVLPDMKKFPLKMSSILLASQRVPVKASGKQNGRKDGGQGNPLVHEGEQYVPNISHVFRQGQHLYLLYEVYAPAKVKQASDATTKVPKGAINLISSLELIQGSTKVFETPVVQATALNEAGRDAIAVELDVPLDQVKPGSYIGQLNVIDDAGGSFAFPRFAVLVREAANGGGAASAAPPH
jgi:hypothetical protein